MYIARESCGIASPDGEESAGFEDFAREEKGR